MSVTIDTTTEITIDLSRNNEIGYTITIIDADDEQYTLKAFQLVTFMRYTREHFSDIQAALDALYNVGTQTPEPAPKPWRAPFADEIPY